MSHDEEMKDIELREDEAQRNAGRSPSIEERSQESSSVVEPVWLVAEFLNPNPEDPKDEEDGNSDTTIKADELPGGRPTQQQPAVRLSSGIDPYHRQEGGLDSRTYGPIDFPTCPHCGDIGSHNGAHFNNPCYPASSPSETPMSLRPIPHRSSYECKARDLVPRSPTVP
jgi:hypothetical protein